MDIRRKKLICFARHSCPRVLSKKTETTKQTGYTETVMRENEN